MMKTIRRRMAENGIALCLQYSPVKQCRILSHVPQYRQSFPCRRSMSVATTTTTTSATSGDRSPPPSPRVKSRAKCVSLGFDFVTIGDITTCC